MLLYSLATVTQINPVVDGAVEAVEYALARERSRTASPRADERVERQPEPATAITGSLMVSPSATVTPSGIHAPPKPRLCGQGRSCRALARFANPDSLDLRNPNGQQARHLDSGQPRTRAKRNRVYGFWSGSGLRHMSLHVSNRLSAGAMHSCSAVAHAARWSAVCEIANPIAASWQLERAA